MRSSLPAISDCYFYHAFDFPDGTSVAGRGWDLRDRFPEYIGHCPLAGKSVLDIGTASGFLAFAAERAGASSVTAIDAASAAEFQRLSFSGALYQTDRLKWIE